MLTEPTLRRVLRAATRWGCDFAEVYFEDTARRTIHAETGRIERVTSGREMGVGIRVVTGDSSSYAYTDDLSDEALLEAARTAASASRRHASSRVIDLSRGPERRVPTVGRPFAGADGAYRVDLVVRGERAARGTSDLIRQVTVDYSETVRRIGVVNSEGLWAEDERVYLNYAVRAIAADGRQLETGTARVGRQQGFELFDRWPPEELGRRAAEQALVNLRARPAPSGPMAVVIANGWGGVLFHEACGHGLEADAVQKGSVYTGRVGQQVASPVVSAYDDATLPNQWGSFGFDDEGQPPQRTVLIEAGRLAGYMYDRIRARKDGRPSTGNGRRQSYRHPPIPRMTNTFIGPGPHRPEEIIRATEYGLYARDLLGGQVNTATGDFVFTVAEGYLIRGGRLEEPVRGATLIGNGPAVLHRIDMVADDLDHGAGTCGKDGQGVPAGVGQPTLRVQQLTVGGTERRDG